MHDLNVINRLNFETFGDKVAQARAAGKHVLVYYAGLAITHVQTYDTAEQVREVTGSEELAVDVTRRYFAPTVPSHGLVRDQSEDRTLGDYVARVNAEESKC